MTGYKLINLSNMLKSLEEERVNNVLSSYSCELNKDVELFLRHKSIEFAKQGLASTHLVFTSYKDEPVLVGYFALSNKFLHIPQAAIESKTMRKRIAKFARRDNDLKVYEIAAPLIAQLGKNFTNGYDQLITGDELLKIACDKVVDIQLSIGGKLVYLECMDIPELIDFYTSNGFFRMHDRILSAHEQKDNGCKYFAQLIKYLHSNGS